MAGRTMVNQMSTPTKYAIIHGGGPGLFASYNRSIPKNNPPQNARIRINDHSYKNENKTFEHEGYSQPVEKKNVNLKKLGKKEITDFRVRSASSSKKYRYNEHSANSPGNRVSSGKKKKKKQFKGNYGEFHQVEQKESILQSVLERNFNQAIGKEQNYLNVKGTIASTSSKKTSNNTS